MKITFLGAVVLFAAQNLLAALRIAEIHMLDARHGWAWSSGLAEHRHLLRTTDGAKTWTDITPSAYPYTEEGSCFRDSQTAWVPVSYHTNSVGGLLRTTDGGKSWTLLNSTNTPVYTESSDCRFFTAKYGVARASDGAAGSSYYNYFETHDGGKTWQPIPLHPRDPDFGPGESPFTFHLSNICGDRMTFNPPGTLVIAYGDMGDETSKHAVRLSISDDFGKNWRDLKLPLPAEFHEALSTPDEPVFFDARHAILDSYISDGYVDNSVIIDTYGALVFYVTQDGGKNWELRRAVLHVSPRSKVNIFAFDNIFVLTDDIFYVSHNGARSWQTIRPNIDIGERAKREVLQLDFVDQQRGWMIISNDIASHPDGDYILYKTSDGGKTWAEVPLRLVK